MNLKGWRIPDGNGGFIVLAQSDSESILRCPAGAKILSNCDERFVGYIRTSEQES